MPPLTTAKAYAGALATGLFAALTAATPLVQGFWSGLFTVVLAVLASYGVVYRVPNASASSISRRRRGPIGNAVDDLIGPQDGEPPA